MKTVLLKGLNDQQQDEMRQAFAASALIRQKVIEVLREKVNTHNKVTRSKDAYGIANWAFLQADAVGYERALLEVVGLLTSESVLDAPAEQPKPKRTYTKRTPKNLLT